MTVTLTYDAAQSRIQITATGLAAADLATVERSTDQMRWATVRGATGLTVSAGTIVDTVYDYEFVPNVANYYRVRGIETGPIVFRAFGTAQAAANGSLNGVLPASIVPGDLLFLLASTRNSGTGTVDPISGWTSVVASGNVRLMSKVYNPLAYQDFEDGTTTGWTTSNAAITNSTAHPHTQARGGVLTVTGSPATAYARYRIPVTTGLRYRASVWIWSAAGYSDTSVGIDWFTAGGSYISSSGSGGAALPASTWTEVTVTAAAPATAAFGEFGPTLGSTPTGQILFFDDAAMDVSPVITFTNGAANETVLAQTWAAARIKSAPITTAAQLNGAAQDIAYPSAITPADGVARFDIAALWKQDDWTSVPGGLNKQEDSSTLGNDAAQAAIAFTNTTPFLSGTFVISGGASAISRALVAVYEHAAYLNEQIASTTPAMTDVWLKSPLRPFLNVRVQLGGSDLATDRPSRGRLYEPAGRSLGVAVTEVGGSRRYPLAVRTTTAQAAQMLAYLIDSGDVLFLHAPAGKMVPAGGVYLLRDDTREARVAVVDQLRHWTIPVTEVAAPGPDVAYALATWTTVLALYGTLADLLAANATWADVLALLPSPSEVIVA